MKFLFAGLLAAGTLVHANNMGIMGAHFVAPTIDGKGNVYNPDIGEIIYDSSDSTFYGRNQSSGWIAFGGSSSGQPVGSILTFAGVSCPTGYLSADGGDYSRTTYADLYAVIGDTHGSGDGSTTFNIPDYRGRFLRGVDGAAGRDPDEGTRVAMNTGGNTGDNIGSVQDDAFQAHWHSYSRGDMAGSTVNSGQMGTGYGGSIGVYSNGAVRAPITDGVNGTPRTSSETRPTNAYVNFCIKY